MSARPVAAALLVAALSLAAGSRADLPLDTDAVLSRFSASGAAVRLPPRLYSAGAGIPLSVPVFALAGKGCATIVVLGAVSTAFALELPAQGRQAPDVVSSVGGIAEIRRCGRERRALSELSLDVRSPRAILETVIAASDLPLPPGRAVLPHRDPGTIPTPSRPGTPPLPGALTRRVEALEQRFRLEGAADVERRLVPTDRSGAGRILMDFAPGCHRVSVLGVPSGPDDTTFRDLDAELDWVSGGPAAADRTESPDSTLTACNAEHDLAVLSFAGAGTASPALLLQARTDLPPSLPERWGSEPRARIAKTLLDRHIPPPPSGVAYETLGATGITSLSFEVVPGQCYVAAVAIMQGAAKAVGLTVATGASTTVAHGDDPTSAAVVAFCAGAAPRARMEVEAHGPGLVWLGAVWPAGRVRLGEGVR